MSSRLILIRRRFGGDAFLNTGDIRLGRSLRFAFKRWGHTGFESVQYPTRCAVAEEFGVASPRDEGVQNAFRAFSRKRQGQLAQDDVFIEFIRR